MESLSTMRRRASDLLQNAQQKLPSVPQLPRSAVSEVTGTWERIEIPPLPRSSHSLDVVAGCAYIFGGEIQPREPVDHDMHVVRLPYSAAGADYYRIKPVAAEATSVSTPALDPTTVASAGDDVDPAAAHAEGKGKEKQLAAAKQIVADVPEPRVGHATAVIGSRIFLFGGRGGPDMKPLEEAGRVWVFDTRTRTWTYLDPVPVVKSGAMIPQPAPRSYHCATAVDKPRDFFQPRPKRAESWRDWAVGDTSKTGIPQAPIVGRVAEDAVDEEDAGYGTFFIHGGCLASGGRASDLWAFNVRTRIWTELPAAPGPGRGGTAICVSKTRLFRFGGYDGQNELGGQLDFLHLEVELFDDRSSKGEVAVRARGGWQSILQNNSEASSADIPAEPVQAWPAARSVACLEALDLGGGRELLVLAMGERDPSSQGHAGAGKFHSDVWTFQLPPLGMSAASLTDAVLQAIGRKTGEGQWKQLRLGPYDDEKDQRVPEPRGWLASATMGDLDETGIVMCGGLGEDNDRLGDAWILRVK